MQSICDEKMEYVTRVERQEIIDIKTEEWPVVPSPEHVLRLLTLFSKLEQPFPTLATPFRLKLAHLEILENCDNNFMVENS